MTKTKKSAPVSKNARHTAAAEREEVRAKAKLERLEKAAAAKPPARTRAQLLERAIEQAAALGDRKVVKQLHQIEVALAKPAGVKKPEKGSLERIVEDGLNAQEKGIQLTKKSRKVKKVRTWKGLVPVEAAPVVEPKAGRPFNARKPKGRAPLKDMDGSFHHAAAPSTSAVDAADVLAALSGTAPKAGGLRGAYLRWLANSSKEFSASYVNGLRRPVGEFIDYCASKGVGSMTDITSETLLQYRQHAEKQGRAISTTRMALARVSTFLRSSGIRETVELSVLRVQHTEAEKAEMAEKAVAE